MESRGAEPPDRPRPGRSIWEEDPGDSRSTPAATDERAADPPGGYGMGFPLAAPATADAGYGEAPAPVRPDKPVWRRALGVLIAVGALLIKFGAKLKGLLLLLPKLKLLTTSASMLVSIAAYALIWGLKFAVGFVLLLLVHELGHVFQLRREGIRATAPMFIPFVGAFVGMKELPKDAAAEARVGLAGPVLGSLGCLVPIALHAATGDEFFKALAFVGFFLNLLNLAPVLPLDGGRAMAALSPWMWLVGFGLLVGFGIAFPNPIVLLIMLLGGYETWRRWRARKSPESQRFHAVRPATRLAVAAVYVGLAVLLVVGMDATFVERDLEDAQAR